MSVSVELSLMLLLLMLCTVKSSLRFIAYPWWSNWPICHRGRLFQTPLFTLRWITCKASPDRCCYHHPVGSCLEALVSPEAASFALKPMPLALRICHIRFLGKFDKSYLSPLQSHVPFRGRLQECLHACTTLLRMINSLFTTCSCVGTSRVLVCVAKLLRIFSAQWRSSHLSKIRHQRKWGNQHRRSDSDSAASAFGANSLPGAFVKQNTLPSFTRRPSFDRSGFHHSACQILCLSHSTVPNTFLAHTENPQGPNIDWTGAKACTTFVRWTVPRAERRAFPHFFRTLSWRCMLLAYGTSCWHLNTWRWLHCQLDWPDMPLDDVYWTLCSTVGLRVTFSKRFSHNIPRPSQLHHHE